MNFKIKVIISLLLTYNLSCQSHARAPDTSINTQLHQYLVGDWCLNKEIYEDEVSFSGDIWSFYTNNNYEIHSDELPYEIINESIKMSDFGTMNVIKVNENEMITKIHSTYFFTKPKCSTETLEALKITHLNNAIISNDIEKIQSLIDEGINISKADLRSGLRSTPLMVAAKENNEKIVKLLLAHNPDLSVKNYMGKTIFDLIKKETINNNIREIINHAHLQ